MPNESELINQMAEEISDLSSKGKIPETFIAVKSSNCELEELQSHVSYLRCELKKANSNLSSINNDNGTSRNYLETLIGALAGLESKIYGNVYESENLEQQVENGLAVIIKSCMNQGIF